MLSVDCYLRAKIALRTDRRVEEAPQNGENPTKRGDVNGFTTFLVLLQLVYSFLFLIFAASN